jgi:hypothetical protein
MKLLSSFLPFAFCSRDPNFKYNKRVVEGLTGTDCDVSALTVAKFEADIKCAEGDFIPEESMCTLQCTSQVGELFEIIYFFVKEVVVAFWAFLQISTTASH